VFSAVIGALITSEDALNIEQNGRSLKLTRQVVEICLQVYSVLQHVNKKMANHVSDDN
jgi:hypothetical protein